MYKLCLRDGGWEFHRPLGDEPSFGPELIGERAKVSRVPMHREGVDRHGGPLWEVAKLAAVDQYQIFGARDLKCVLRTKRPPF